MLKNPYILLLIGEFFFIVMSSCIKAISGNVPLYEIVFFRSIVSVVLIGIFMGIQRTSLMPRNIPIMIVRALASSGCMFCNFYGIAHLQLGDAIMLLSTFPLFVAILSFFFLGEKLTKKLIFLVIIGWLGILLILRPQFQFFEIAGIVSLCSGLLAAVDIISIRWLAKSEPLSRVAIYFVLTATMMAAPFMIHNFVVPPTRDILLLTIAGLLGTIVLVLLTMAFSLERVSRISPLSYSAVVMAFVAGLIFWNEKPTLWSIVGSVVVIGCCVGVMKMKEYGEH